jgi:hypothetical protein
MEQTALPAPGASSALLRLAQAERLGALQATYSATAHWLSNTLQWLLATLILLIVLLLIVPAWNTRWLIFGAFASALAVAGATQTPRMARTLGLRISLFEHGLIQTQHGQSEVIRWDQVVATLHRASILCRADGSRLVLKDIGRDSRIIRERVRRETNRLLLPRAIARYNAGEPISFGDLSVSPSGLMLGPDTLPWKHLSGIRLDPKGYLTIQQAGLSQAWWYYCDADEVPNLFLLLALLEKIIHRLHEEPLAEQAG